MRFPSAGAAALRDNGIDTMFGVMGDANMYIVNSFHQEAGGRFISTSHESGAVLMASGYAAVTGRVGAATVTHGAIANTVSALLDGVRGRYPVVVVAGDTAAMDTFNLQNVPQRDIVMPTGAGFEQARSPQTIGADVGAAVRRARTERRPIVLNIPADFGQHEVDYSAIPPPAPPSPVWVADTGAVENAVGLVSAARRPLIICGRGAARPDSRKAVRRLAERIGAPLATTLRGKDLFRGDAFNLGIAGTLATPIGLDTIVRADCLIVFGASLNALTTDGGDLLRGKRIVQCDVDPGAFGRYYPVDIALTGDAGRVADAMVELLDAAEVAPSRYRSPDLAHRLAAQSTVAMPYSRRAPHTVDLADALSRINQLVAPDRTLVIDGGRFSHLALQTMNVLEPNAYVHALNVGHIGLGVGYGIGAAIGRPDRPALVVVGDGGFMLGGLTEFNTAVRHHVDLVVAVMNDGAYGAEYYRFVDRSLDPSLTTFNWPDFAAVATALGGVGLTVRNRDDFTTLGSTLAERDRPVLVDVRLDPAAIPEPGRH
jgi:thiamine pyrophosphate-dependent acetolactate synthase large subunit-like protein